jgi:hypothetical protein
MIGLFFPLIFVMGLSDSPTNPLTAKIVLATLVIEPALIVLHELGHFLTARLLGLDAWLMTLGVGPPLWSGKIFGVPLRLHGWPLSGLTYLGSRTRKRLRLRLWITVLMGPMTNILLIGVAELYRDAFARLFGKDMVLMWIIVNAFLAIVNLLPHKFRRAGQLHQSDGMRLLRVPFKTDAALEVFLYAEPLLAALELFSQSDYAGARELCREGLRRSPGNPWLTVTLSACQINFGEYEAAIAALRPLQDALAGQAPEVRAAINNNLAVATWLHSLNTRPSAESTSLADALSANAYLMYPCVLPYRSTRALLLAATRRADEALALLDYTNYEHGSSADRGDRQIARAFALRSLHRDEEAERALGDALKLQREPRPWLRTLGLI